MRDAFRRGIILKFGSLSAPTFLLVFFVALLLEDVGFILLSRGMKESSSSPRTPQKSGRFKRVLKNPRVLTGVFLQAIYYILLLSLIQKAPVSLVVPMTGFGYVLTAFLARIFLGEPVSFGRWAGIFLITVGVVLISQAGG